jgi:hypothetical protein
MFPGRSACNPPKLLKPLIKFALRDFAEPPLFQRRFPVSARLSLHKDEFDVAFDDGVRLVRLSKKLGAPLDFIIRVGDFMPNDGIEIVESNFSAGDAYVRVQGDDDVPPVLFAGQTDIPNDADQPTAGDQDPKSFFPDFGDL